jgi:ribosomal-protein-alanine N-acetyltransferase
MKIRSLAEADLSLIRTWMRETPEAPAWSNSEAPAWSNDDLAGIVKAPSAGQRKIRRGWVAEEEGRSAIAGFVVATALCIPNILAECELEFVFVSPEARRQGIGRTLMQTVFAWARDLGAKEIRLEVRESNMRALRLYERCGFTIAGRRPGYYVDPPEDAVLMRGEIEHERGDAPV